MESDHSDLQSLLLIDVDWKHMAMTSSLFCSLGVLDLTVGHTMDVLSPFIPVLCHSDWLFHGQSCPRRPCVFFLACVHLALFLALSLSPGNYFVSSWCDHSTLACLLWQYQFPLNSSFVKNPLIGFLCWPQNLQNISPLFHLKGVETCFFILSECSAFTLPQPH